MNKRKDWNFPLILICCGTKSLNHAFNDSPPATSIHLLIHSSLPPSIHSTSHVYSQPSILPSILPSIDPSIYPLSDILSILPSICLYNQSLTHPSSIMTDVVREIGKVKEL